MSIGERIKSLREMHGMTQEDLAKICKVSDKAISTWENGKNIPRMGPVQRMADYFGISKSAILDDYFEPAKNAVSTKSLRIPVLGRIPAGIPIEAIEDIEDWEELPASMARSGNEYFGLRVRGDSMKPEYRDGDTLIILRQETCETGDDCAVLIDGDEATFKRVRLNEKGITLQPLNPAYDPMFFSNQEIEELPVRILGVVVEVRRKIRR